MRHGLFILFLLFQVNLGAQIKWSDFDNYTRYTVKDGLLTNKVHNLIEDKDGFLWLGSEKGVSRFDGSTFTNYPNFSDDGQLKPIGDVLELVIDNKGEHIYVTSRSGILVSPIKNPKFQKLKAYYPFIDIDIDIGQCTSLYLDNKKLWVGLVGYGLLKLDLETGDYEHIKIDEKDPSNKPFEEFYHIQAIVPDDIHPNLLWVGTTEGLIRFDTLDDTYTIHQYKNNKELFQRYINEVFPYKDNVYVGSNGGNWYVFEKDSNTSHQVIDRDSELFHFDITKFLIDDDGTIWISSYFQGVVQYDPIKKTILRGVNNNYSIGKVLGITLRDSRGIVWFGDGNGLYKYNPNESIKFIHLIKKNDFDYPYPMKRIVQIGDHYYVSPSEGGDIFKINAQDLTTSVISIPQLKEIPGTVLRDIAPMRGDSLLVLGNQKVYILNTLTNQVTEPPIQIRDSQINFLRSVVKDMDDNYWIATNKEGLFKFNYENETFETFKDQFKNKTSRNHDYFKHLYVDSENRLWIGQASTTVMNLKNDSIFCLNPEFNYESTRPFGNFYEDDNNRMWVANLFDGISYVDKGNITSGLTKVVEGSFDGVYRYNDSIIWTVGEGQLGLLNTNTLVQKPINLKPNTHFSGPIVEMENGRYMIGYDNGILIYDPTKLSAQKEKPALYIQALKANNKTVYRGSDLKKDDFSLQSGTKSLSVSVGALAFQHPEQISYAYKLGDGAWVDLANSREINLSNLNQGNYSLDLKATNAMGNNTSTHSFNFTIQPYWYTSNLAMLFYILILSGTIYALYKFNLNRKLAILESKRIKEIDDLKSKMFANISHELRTPLTLIKGFTSMLVKKDEGVKNKNLAKGIESNSDQLLNLVNQMLDLSELDANRMEVHYKNADIVAFIEKCVALYKSFSQSKLQHLSFDFNIGRLKMDFDDDKLQKILNNLLSNAIKYTPEKGQIAITLKKIGEQVQISVSDTGKGIPQSSIDSVFDRYYKTNDLNGNIGNGIGLALTKELVELMDGGIQVKSTEEKGSTFFIKLPIKNEAQEMPTKHFSPFIAKESWDEEMPDPKNIKTGKSTILLVEDNKDIQHFITSLLSDTYHVLIANNGTEGIKQAQKKDIDFIISDVMMPHTDGFEFCQNIKSNVTTSHIPFLMLSARTHTQDKQKAYALGVDAYLTKPFHPDELISIIENLLQKQKRQQEYLLELLHINKPDVEKPDISKLDTDLITNLQKIILDNPTKLSANEIAKELFLSRTQLHRKIKTLTGKSLTQYTNHIRIEKAKHLLRATDLQVNEIAYATGYESPSYFIRLFKKEVGDTPENFKNKAAIT